VTRTVIYRPPKGFSASTVMKLEDAERGEVIFPIDQPLWETDDWVRIDGFLNSEELNRIDVIAGPLTAAEEDGFAARRQIWPDKRSAWLYELIGSAMADYNLNLRLALSGFVEPITVLEHHTGDETKLHCDYTSWERCKIGMIVLLNSPDEWSGGEFKLALAKWAEHPTALTKGDALMYAGWVPHQVKRVTAGVRRTLVSFAYGPNFT
jgi:hypothetical protein